MKQTYLEKIQRRLNEAKTKNGFRNAVMDYLERWAKQHGYEHNLPVKVNHGWSSDKATGICWEGAPFEWAVCLSGNSALWAGETGRYSEPGEIDVCSNRHGLYLECETSFWVSVASI